VILTQRGPGITGFARIALCQFSVVLQGDFAEYRLTLRTRPGSGDVTRSRFFPDVRLTCSPFGRSGKQSGDKARFFPRPSKSKKGLPSTTLPERVRPKFQTSNRHRIYQPRSTVSALTVSEGSVFFLDSFLNQRINPSVEVKSDHRWTGPRSGVFVSLESPARFKPSEFRSATGGPLGF